MPRIQSAVRSHIGRVRANNEDNFFLDGLTMSPENCDRGASFEIQRDALFHVYAVSDGMGGEAAGELASYEAVLALVPLKDDLRRGSLSGIHQALKSGNEAILQRARKIGKRMGATITLFCLVGNEATVAYLGDSRAYLLRDGTLRQLTSDHTEAQRRIFLGLLTPEEALHHPSNHMLTRHLGMDSDEYPFEGDFAPPLRLHEGDVFLLCSDGLTGMLPDSAIAQTLLTHADAGAAANALLERALAAGGHDNITAMVLRAMALDAVEEEPVEATADLDENLRPDATKSLGMGARRNNWLSRFWGRHG